MTQTIRLTVGRFAGATVPVITQDQRTVRAELAGVGTICLPVRSDTTGIRYFEPLTQSVSVCSNDHEA